MSSTPLTDEQAARAFGEMLQAWAADLLANDQMVALEGTNEPDGRGQWQWLLRFAGEEKQFIALWLSVRQRTVYVESEIMPAPEENTEEVLRFALTKNAELYPLHIAIGPDSGLYLVTRFPVGEGSPELLDELCGATLRYVDELFPTMMARGFASVYRRRSRRASH